MKIQNLAVIFIIIILPISLILTAYVQNQVKTLELQMSYDTKLTNATYDAVKAFQLNTVNSATSDLANSKLRDIKASANTFFNSIATQFNMSGYKKDVLKDYVPALVYTMYDGYYIYSPFKNTLTGTTVNDDATYKNGEWETDLKPYIHYSCRYKTTSVDVVITYSLDNYISVRGTVDNKAVNKSGYLIKRDSVTTNGGIKYRGVNIGTENLQENVATYNENSTENNGITTEICLYTKINGVKYYTKDNGNSWFSILNGQKYQQSNARYKTENKSGQLYYKEAKDFTEWLENTSLKDLTTADVVDEEGNSLRQNELFNTNEKIFTEDENGISIEDPNSKFNQHRLAVIRYSIEKNLSIAIANYNSYSNATTEFRMPKLKEDEWDKILNNVSVISFLQGLSIGGKIYNGYSIVTNTKTEEVVNTDSLYLITNDNEYHRVTEKGLENKNIVGAYLNNDFEVKRIVDNQNNTLNFFLHGDIKGSLTASYSSIIMQTNVADIDSGNIYKYVASLGNNEVSQNYFTALGRERYSMYKTNNNVNEIINKLSQ